MKLCGWPDFTFTNESLSEYQTWNLTENGTLTNDGVGTVFNWKTQFKEQAAWTGKIMSVNLGKCISSELDKAVQLKLCNETSNLW